jgi:hypothetical protein
MSKPRAMTLDLLRSRYKKAAALAATSPAALDLYDRLSIIYIGPSGEHTEISESHLLDDAKCQPGRYLLRLDGPPGIAFEGEALLADPTGMPGSWDPNAASARYLCTLLDRGEKFIDDTSTRLEKANERVEHLEELTLTLFRRVRELEATGSGAAGGQRELFDVLERLLMVWVGLGGKVGRDTIRHAVTVLQLVQQDTSVQEAIRTAGGGEPLRHLLGGA